MYDFKIFEELHLSTALSKCLEQGYEPVSHSQDKYDVYTLIGKKIKTNVYVEKEIVSPSLLASASIN